MTTKQYRRALEELELSQSAAAKYLGVTRPHVTELGARVLRRSPLRRAPVAPSAQRQNHAQ